MGSSGHQPAHPQADGWAASMGIALLFPGASPPSIRLRFSALLPLEAGAANMKVYMKVNMFLIEKSVKNKGVFLCAVLGLGIPIGKWVCPLCPLSNVTALKSLFLPITFPGLCLRITFPLLKARINCSFVFDAYALAVF